MYVLAHETAYEVLKDKEKRQLYDKFGEEGLKQQGGNRGGFTDPFDLFNSFGFGGFGQGRGQHREGRKGGLLLLLTAVCRECAIRLMNAHLFSNP